MWQTARETERKRKNWREEIEKEIDVMEDEIRERTRGRFLKANLRTVQCRWARTAHYRLCYQFLIIRAIKPIKRMRIAYERIEIMKWSIDITIFFVIYQNYKWSTMTINNEIIITIKWTLQLQNYDLLSLISLSYYCIYLLSRYS